MPSAVGSRLAYARLSAVATASRLPTANRDSNNSYTTSWDTTIRRHTKSENVPVLIDQTKLNKNPLVSVTVPSPGNPLSVAVDDHHSSDNTIVDELSEVPRFLLAKRGRPSVVIAAGIWSRTPVNGEVPGQINAPGTRRDVGVAPSGIPVTCCRSATVQISNKPAFGIALRYDPNISVLQQFPNLRFTGIRA